MKRSTSSREVRSAWRPAKAFLLRSGLSSRSRRVKNAFTLRDLELRPDLNKKAFAGLQADLTSRDDVDRFMNQTIRSVVIRNWPSVAFLHTVFIRLNMGSVQLSPQELRQALF